MNVFTRVPVFLSICYLADKPARSLALTRPRDPPAPVQLESNVTKVKVRVPLSTGAACLDGSPYVMTIAYGPRSTGKKWTLFMQGGGFCQDEEACELRSTGVFGSNSEHLEKCECMNFAENGEEEDCTCVTVPYCDGGLFTGHRDKPLRTANGKTLTIRGRRNLEVAFDTLLNHHGMKDAESVILTGESGCGFATMMHLDRLAELMPSSVNFRGLPVNGFVIDHKDVNNTYTYLAEMENIYYLHNSSGSISPECYVAFKDAPWKCMVSSHMARYVKTPMFLLASMYDAWQLAAIRGLNRGSIFAERAGVTSLASEVSAYGSVFMHEFNSFMESAQVHKYDHSAFLVSCICHDHCPYTTSTFHGANMTKQLGLWLNGGTSPAIKSIQPGVFIDKRESIVLDTNFRSWQELPKPYYCGADP